MFSLMFQYGAPTAFKKLIRQLESGGFLYFVTDLLLPFLLIFSLMYAILNRVAIFTETKEIGGQGEKVPNSKINATVSALLALFVVIPHIAGVYPVSKDPVIIIKNILPGGFIILIAVLLLMAIVILSSGDTPSAFTWLIALGAGFFLLYLIAAAVFPKMSWGPIKDPGVQVLLIAILIAILWIWFLIKPPGSREAWGFEIKKTGGNAPRIGG